MVAQHNPMIKKAVGILMHLSADEQFRMEAAARDKATRDYNTLMSESYEDGLEKGEIRKRAEFLALLKSGKRPEEIIKMYEK